MKVKRDKQGNDGEMRLSKAILGLQCQPKRMAVRRKDGWMEKNIKMREVLAYECA
jgi:hypothetical protein